MVIVLVRTRILDQSGSFPLFVGTTTPRIFLDQALYLFPKYCVYWTKRRGPSWTFYFKELRYPVFLYERHRSTWYPEGHGTDVWSADWQVSNYNGCVLPGPKGNRADSQRAGHFSLSLEDNDLSFKIKAKHIPIKKNSERENMKQVIFSWGWEGKISHEFLLSSIFNAYL